jgi:hypothetical protein
MLKPTTSFWQVNPVATIHRIRGRSHRSPRSPVGRFESATRGEHTTFPASKDTLFFPEHRGKWLGMKRRKAEQIAVDSNELSAASLSRNESGQMALMCST